MYAVDIAPKAKRQLKKLAKKQRAIYLDVARAIDSLEHYPNVKGVKSLVNHDYQYRLRVGNFRILFNAYSSVEIIEVQEVKKRNESTY